MIATKYFSKITNEKDRNNCADSSAYVYMNVGCEPDMKEFNKSR